MTKPFLPFLPRFPKTGRGFQQRVPLRPMGGHKSGLSHSNLFLSVLLLLEKNRQFPASCLLQWFSACQAEGVGGFCSEKLSSRLRLDTGGQLPLFAQDRGLSCNAVRLNLTVTSRLG